MQGIVHQGHLEKQLHILFPGYRILQNVRKEANIVYPPSGLFLEVDLWLPDIKLAFEFQDAHHYTTTWRSNVPLEQIQNKDKRGETLVTIPFWWDGSLASLIATIRKFRPELLVDHSGRSLSVVPIDESPPSWVFNTSKVPGIGELMLPIFMNSSQFDPSNWWMSEKYDGVRVCWNPSTSELYSKHGTKISLLDEIIDNFPDHLFLDCEFWLGRRTFEDAVVLSRKKYEYKEDYYHFWPFLRITVFDNPDPILKKENFETRFSLLLHHLDPFHPFLIPSFYVKCINKRQLVKTTEITMEGGGEGIVIRKPRSHYHNGRSDSLLKFKANRMDLEALVLSPGSDSCLYKLQLPGGITFEAPYEGNRTIEKGQIVCVSFQSFSTTGKPTNPLILRVREDVSWKIERETEIVEGEEREESEEREFMKQFPHPLTHKALSESTRRAHGFWTRDEGKNAKEFFLSLSSSLSRDPLLPESWYDITSDIVISQEGGQSILAHFGGSFSRAICFAFPEINFDLNLFSGTFWALSSNRRHFFEEYAKKKGFDPRVADNWYTISTKDIFLEKSANNVMRHHGGDVISALVNLFPILKKSKFSRKVRQNSVKIRIPPPKFKLTTPLLGKRYTTPIKSKKQSLPEENSKLRRGLSNVKGMLMFIKNKNSR